MTIEQFVVFWLTMTFHRQNSNADNYAIFGNFNQQLISQKHTSPHQMPTSDHRILPSAALLLHDMVVKD
jgi:hypothetical protein